MSEYGEITLVPESYELDAIGQPISAAGAGRTIPCRISSAGRNEWSAAAQGGYNAEYLIEIFTASYQREKIAIIDGQQYTIYRTYQVGDTTELYLGTRVGDY